MNIPHPYASQHGIQVYASDGAYVARGKTYGVRELLRSLGGKWNPDSKAWLISREAAGEMVRRGAYMMIRVQREAHCHEAAGISVATQHEVACGKMLIGCPMCDTSAVCGDVVRITEVIDKDAASLAGVDLPRTTSEITGATDNAAAEYPKLDGGAE